MLLSVREALEDDGEGVAALWTEAYSGPVPAGRDAPDAVAEFEEARAAARMFVAEEGGALVGVAVLHPAGAPGSGLARLEEAELSRLAVARPSRRRGIGWALVSECVDRAVVAGAGAVVVWARPHQHAAHDFFAAFGFEREPARDSVDEVGPRLAFRIDLRLGDPLAA